MICVCLPTWSLVGRAAAKSFNPKLPRAHWIGPELGMWGIRDVVYYQSVVYYKSVVY